MSSMTDEFLGVFSALPKYVDEAILKAHGIGSDSDVEHVMKVTKCTEEQALQALSDSGNRNDAVIAALKLTRDPEVDYSEYCMWHPTESHGTVKCHSSSCTNWMCDECTCVCDNCVDLTKKYSTTLCSECCPNFGEDDDE
jgi:hypothetical protein